MAGKTKLERILKGNMFILMFELQVVLSLKFLLKKKRSSTIETLLSLSISIDKLKDIEKSMVKPKELGGVQVLLIMTGILSL
jgi:hypothetical protein